MMKVFNKLIALLIVTAFITPNNVSAAPRTAAPHRGDIEHNRGIVKKGPIKSPVMNLKSFPPEMKNHIKLYLFEKTRRLPSESEEIKYSPQDIKQALAALQVKENQALGITQKLRNYLVGRQFMGYRPNDPTAIGKNVLIVPAALPEDLHYYLSLSILDAGEALGGPAYTPSQAKVTKMLNQLQQREHRTRGITKRLSTFLQNKYSLQARPGVKPVPNNIGKKPTPIKTVVPKANSKVTPAPHNPAKKAPVARAPQPKVIPTPNNPVKKAIVVKAPQPKVIPTPNNPTKKAIVGRTPQPKVIPTPNNPTKKAIVVRPPQPKVIPTPNNPVKKGAQPNIKKPVPVPVNTPRKALAKAPKDYLIYTMDIPVALKNDLILFGFEEGIHRFQPSEIRGILKTFQVLEKVGPGMTARVRQYLKSIGYNPNRSGTITVITSKLPKDFKNLLELESLLGRFIYGDLPPHMPLEQRALTMLINHIQKCEARLPGLPGRIRALLKSKYGFQG